LQQNEVVCALELVSLDSVSNSSGRKDYIAVGTMISHGEDRPTKGTIYLLDIVETVPSPAHPGTLKHKLKLVDREDLKGPVTALTDLNGYLVHSIGQKVSTEFTSLRPIHFY
jgi:cleavage and polyadenylation specificity factor subunit 1